MWWRLFSLLEKLVEIGRRVGGQQCIHRVFGHGRVHDSFGALWATRCWVVCVGGRKGKAGDSLCGKGVFWERLRWRWLEVLWSRLVGRHLFGGYFGTASI